MLLLVVATLLGAILGQGEQATHHATGQNDDSALPGATPTVEKAPARTGTIEGRVSGHGGPVADASVTAIRLGRLPAGDSRFHRVATRRDGSFVLDGLDQGATWRLEVTAPGHKGTFVPRIQANAEPVAIELESGPRMIGSTWADGRGVAATVTVAAPGMFPSQESTARPNGEFATEPLEPGNYELLAQFLDGDQAWALEARVGHDEEPSDDPVELKLERAGIIDVRPVDSLTGEPIPRALVTLARDELSVLSLKAWSNAGSAVFAGVPMGGWVVVVRAERYLPLTRRFLVEPPFDEPLTVPLDMTPGRSIRGRIVDSAFQPVPLVSIVADVTTTTGAQWSVTRDETANISSLVAPGRGQFLSFDSAFGFLSDDDGHFEVAGLPAGRVVLRASPWGYRSATVGPFDLSHSHEIDGIEIVLLPGYELRGRVVGPDEEIVGHARIEVQDQVDGTSTGPLRRPARGTITDEYGGFVLTDLPEQVSVTASAEGYLPATHTVLVDADEEVALVLQPVGAPLRGVVLSASQPVGEALVTHRDEAGRTVCQARTDERGRFSLEGCPDVRPLPVSVSGPTIVETRSVLTDESEENLIEATTGHDCTIYVSDPDGLALVGATLCYEHDDNQRCLREQTTDESGSAILRALAPGTTRVSIAAEGLATQEIVVTLVDECPELTARLEAQRQREVSVTDRYRSPVAGAIVTAAGLPERTTDEQGRAVWENPPAGPRQFVARHPEVGRGHATFDLATGSDDLIVTIDAPTIDLNRYKDSLAAVGVVPWRDGGSVLVESLEPDGAAAAAGVRRGDVLLGVSATNDRVELELWRRGSRVSVTARTTP